MNARETEVVKDLVEAAEFAAERLEAGQPPKGGITELALRRLRAAIKIALKLLSL